MASVVRKILDFVGETFSAAVAPPPEGDPFAFAGELRHQGPAPQYEIWTDDAPVRTLLARPEHNQTVVMESVGRLRQLTEMVDAHNANYGATIPVKLETSAGLNIVSSQVEGIRLDVAGAKHDVVIVGGPFNSDLYVWDEDGASARIFSFDLGETQHYFTSLVPEDQRIKPAIRGMEYTGSMG
jgi:hypothetical protein